MTKVLSACTLTPHVNFDSPYVGPPLALRGECFTLAERRLSEVLSHTKDTYRCGNYVINLRALPRSIIKTSVHIASKQVSGGRRERQRENLRHGSGRGRWERRTCSVLTRLRILWNLWRFRGSDKIQVIYGKQFYEFKGRKTSDTVNNSNNFNNIVLLDPKTCEQDKVGQHVSILLIYRYR